MMKKFLLLCFAALLSSTVCAQNSNLQDVVHLKNGSIIRGTIIEQVPGESIKIETRDGNVFVYQMDEISKMTREQNPNKDTRIKTNQFSAKPNGYAGFIEAEFGFGVGELSPDLPEYRSADRFEIDIINGYQFNPYCFLGLGIGFNTFTNAEKKGGISIPVFVQGRFNLLDKRVSPFLALNIGYNINTRRGEVHKKSSYTTTITYPGGIIVEPTVGGTCRLSNKTAITWGISYSFMQFKIKETIDYYDESETEVIKSRPKAVRLKVGVTF